MLMLVQLMFGFRSGIRSVLVGSSVLEWGSPVVLCVLLGLAC